MATNGNARAKHSTIGVPAYQLIVVYELVRMGPAQKMAERLSGRHTRTSGWLSMLDRARSVERIISRISWGLRAVSRLCRKVAGSFRI